MVSCRPSHTVRFESDDRGPLERRTTSLFVVDGAVTFSWLSVYVETGGYIIEGAACIDNCNNTTLSAARHFDVDVRDSEVV